ncbi:MAG: hypothetical protein ACP5U1_00990, partial [Desulfomonilaceae bacterium]
MAFKTITTIFSCILLASVPAFGFQPQSGDNYVSGLVTKFQNGKHAPQTSSVVRQAHAPAHAKLGTIKRLTSSKKTLPNLSSQTIPGPSRISEPRVKAKALFCLDKSKNRVILAENECAPLPIASITKLLTAMVVI